MPSWSQTISRIPTTYTGKFVGPGTALQAWKDAVVTFSETASPVFNAGTDAQHGSVALAITGTLSLVTSATTIAASATPMVGTFSAVPTPVAVNEAAKTLTLTGFDATVTGFGLFVENYGTAAQGGTFTLTAIDSTGTTTLTLTSAGVSNATKAINPRPINGTAQAANTDAEFFGLSGLVTPGTITFAATTGVTWAIGDYFESAAARTFDAFMCDWMEAPFNVSWSVEGIGGGVTMTYNVEATLDDLNDTSITPVWTALVTGLAINESGSVTQPIRALRCKPTGGPAGGSPVFRCIQGMTAR